MVPTLKVSVIRLVGIIIKNDKTCKRYRNKLFDYLASFRTLDFYDLRLPAVA